MKQLQELAGIPSRATVRQILKGNGQVKATESLTHKLYELIRKGDLDDDGMVKKLYGKNRTPSYGPYRTLKTRLRHVLIQAVFYKVGLLAGSFTEECKSIAMKYPRISQIQSIVGDIEVTGCIHRGEYHKAIQALDSSLEKLQECKGVSSISLSLISINKVECTLKLRDFDLGIKQIEEAKLVIEQNTINGVKLSELAIQLGLATNNYLFAYRELVKMDKRMMNRLLGARAVEAWRILEAYLFFLLVAGKINLPEGEPEIKNFRLNKFLNEVPFYAKDKEGMNIQIIILQVLFLIVQKKYSKAIDKIESLERYCSRYLKEGENFRNNCFFKLLLCVIKANFNRVAAERKGKSVLDKMITKSGGNPGVIEIIPYERLWGILLDNLESTRKMQPTYQTA
jgi:hypothetical protein